MFNMWGFCGLPIGAGWFGIVGIILMILFWTAIIALIIWLVRYFTGRLGHVHRYDPLDVAKERYARGEITKEQFEQIKRDIS